MEKTMEELLAAMQSQQRLAPAAARPQGAPASFTASQVPSSRPSSTATASGGTEAAATVALAAASAQRSHRPLVSQTSRPTVPSREQVSNATANYNELVSLLHPPGAPAANSSGHVAQAPTVSGVSPSIPSQHHPSTAHASAGSSNQHLTGRTLDISAELEAVVASQIARRSHATPQQARHSTPTMNSTATQSLPQQRLAVISNSIRPPAHSSSSDHSSPASNQSARRPQGQPQVTQEQVVVGHFCRHAIKTLGREMGNQPNKSAKEEELRNMIKELWTQWVKGLILKQVLLERVSEFVRNSTPSARNIDVTREFRQWYQHQLQLQAIRSNRGSNSTGAGRQPSTSAPQAAGGQATQALNSSGHVSSTNSLKPHANAVPASQHTQRPSQDAPTPAPAPEVAAQQSQMRQAVAPVSVKRPQALVQLGATPGRDDSNTISPAAAAAAAAIPPAAKKPRLASKNIKKATPKELSEQHVSQETAGALKLSRLQAPKATSGAPASSPAPVLPSNVTSAPTAPSEPVKKPVRKVDDELDIVRNIVDIEGEEDMLVAQSTALSSSVANTSDYNSNMLLAGAALRQKLEEIVNRQGLDPKISSDAMEVVSLAARERLAVMLEELGEISKSRAGTVLTEWSTVTYGPNISERMRQQREQEQRALLASADHRKQKAAKAAAKDAENIADAEKSVKEAAATAEAKKKEDALKEKERMAQKTQRNALLKVVGKMGKKSRSRRDHSGTSRSLPSSGGDAALTLGARSANSDGSMPNGRKTDNSGSRQAGASNSAGSVDGTKEGDKGGGLGSYSSGRGDGLPPVPKLSSRAHGAAGSRTKTRRPPITIRDCLFYMEQEPRMRKSPLLYRWYSRYGLHKPPKPMEKS